MFLRILLGFWLQGACPTFHLDAAIINLHILLSHIASFSFIFSCFLRGHYPCIDVVTKNLIFLLLVVITCLAGSNSVTMVSSIVKKGGFSGGAMLDLVERQL